MGCAAVRHAATAGTLGTTMNAAGFLHVTLPTGLLRDVEPCPLGEDGVAALRKILLPKLARGSVVLPARPRYRLTGSLQAVGGRLFELRTRHGAGFVVARIGIGWRDHGANLVWAACARSRMAEPRRPWVVDALDAAGVAMLKPDEAAAIKLWVPVLARDLAWAVAFPDAFLRGQVLRPVEEDHAWEVRDTREFGPHTSDPRENDVAGEVLLWPRRPISTPSANRADARRAATRPRSNVAKVAVR